MRREYLDGGDAAEVSPVVPVRSCNHDGGVVGDVFPHDELGTVR